MIIKSFKWDDENVSHIARHQVIPIEVEEVFNSKYFLHKGKLGRYVALGKTVSGRYLFCVLDKTEKAGSIRIITARDMSNTERKLFKRKVLK